MKKPATAKKPELLAPAGNLAKMKTAFAFGADAVYAGIPDFSLRVRINDFTLDSLKEATEYAHGLGKKIYVTINIFAQNEHLDKLPAYIKQLKKIGPDALIVSDPGVMVLIKKSWPGAEMHLSTQANCTNGAAALFWQQSGVKRVILGREVAYDDIAAIAKSTPKLELETFVHGAMCMAYSGRCFLSKYLLDRSANLGDCVQPCRWSYSVQETTSAIIKPHNHAAEFELVEEAHGSYILNSQDMCLMRRLPELMKASIASFKIEGRAKSAYYLAMVVGAYRKAIDELSGGQLDGRQEKFLVSWLYRELEDKLVHRGYTEGFMFGQGQQAQNLADAHNSCAWEFCGQVIGGERSKGSLVRVHNALRLGDAIEVIAPGFEIIKQKVKSIKDAKTGEALQSAHGGQAKEVYLDLGRDVSVYSVIRRKLLEQKAIS